MTPTQTRAGRALLDWTQTDLARHAALTDRTVLKWEAGAVVSEETRAAIRDALVRGGVRFTQMGVEFSG